MKTLLILPVLLILMPHAVAQEDFPLRAAASIPESVTGSTTGIASYIKKNADTDLDRVRMAYSWVITHITYDLRSRDLVILNEDRGLLIESALKKRRGVCENFAYLFADICGKMGFPAFVIGGYTRQNGSVDRDPHAWCTVYLDHGWALYDPTWDAGNPRSVNMAHFKVAPQTFIDTHMPFDPLFQLLHHPVSFDDFNKGRVQENLQSPFFDFADSLDQYQKMDPLERYRSAEERIEKNGTPNSLVHTKVTQLKMEIEIIRQDEDSVNYNGAVASYNHAVSLLNEFISYRNSQFRPARTDSSVMDLFEQMQSQLTLAQSQIRKVNESKATLLLNTGDLEYALEKLKRKVTDQRNFYESTREKQQGP